MCSFYLFFENLNKTMVAMLNMLLFWYESFCLGASLGHFLDQQKIILTLSASSRNGNVR